MSRFKAIVVASAASLVLASGIAFANGDDLVARGFTLRSSDVTAAQRSLAEAMDHLQKLDSTNASVKRAYAYMSLAQSELQNSVSPKPQQLN